MHEYKVALRQRIAQSGRTVYFSHFLVWQFRSFECERSSAFLQIVSPFIVRQANYVFGALQSGKVPWLARNGSFLISMTRLGDLLLIGILLTVTTDSIGVILESRRFTFDLNWANLLERPKASTYLSPFGPLLLKSGDNIWSRFHRLECVPTLGSSCGSIGASDSTVVSSLNPTRNNSNALAVQNRR